MRNREPIWHQYRQPDDYRNSEPPVRDSYQEKLDRWKEGWNRELDDDLANGR